MTSQPPEPPSHHADDHDDPKTYDAPDIDDLESAPEEITADAGDEADVSHPVNWRTLTAEDAEYEWLALNEWVDWLRHAFGLPASVIPPYWHRHPELVWELSALHLHWLGAYHPAQHASAPIGWMTDFRAAQARLREWVALSGTRLDRDRPTRQTPWPGEDLEPGTAETPITNRDEDFVAFVITDVNRRADAEVAFLRRGESGED
jgi:hypothetical protein